MKRSLESVRAEMAGARGAALCLEIVGGSALAYRKECFRIRSPHLAVTRARWDNYETSFSTRLLKYYTITYVLR